MTCSKVWSKFIHELDNKIILKDLTTGDIRYNNSINSSSLVPDLWIWRVPKLLLFMKIFINALSNVKMQLVMTELLLFLMLR